MNIVELKTKIILNQIPNLLIFTGPELEVMNIYIKQIQQKLKYKFHKVETIVDVIKLCSGNSIFNTKKLFIVTDDLNFLKQENTWDKLITILGQNKLIIKFHNYDKRLSFWKKFNNETVIFERMSDNILANHLKKQFNLHIDNCLFLANNCDKDYFRCKLELDKINNIARAKNISIDDAFNECKNEILCFDNNVEIEEFAKCVLTKNFSKAFVLLDQFKNKNEPSLKILSYLYNGFKNVLIAQTTSAKNIQKNTGLNYYYYTKAKELSGYYTVLKIEEILYNITKLEQDIKLGKIDSSIVIDFLFTII